MVDRDSFNRWFNSLPWWQQVLLMLWSLTPILAIATLVAILVNLFRWR